MNNVRVSGPLVFTEQNCPSRAGEIINSISEIYDILNPRVGMLVYVKNEDKNYTITGLREKVIEGVAVPNAQVDTYRCVEAELLNRIQGTSKNSNASTDPFRYLGNLSKTKFFETIDALNGDSAASREECAGHFRAAVEHRIVDVYSEQIGWANNVWVQRMVCPMQLFNEVAQKENVYTKTGVDKDGNTAFYKYRTHTYTQNFGTLTGASTNQNTVKTYTRTCNNGVWGDWKDVSNNYINSQNYGKKIAFFGGSFALNMSLTSTPWSFDYQGRTYSLMQYIAEKLGATSFDDYAVGSQGVIVGDIPIIEQLQTAGAGYDIYVIFGGINDFGNEIPLGESNGAANDTTYCGGLKAAFDWIRSNNKSAKIYTVTPFKAYTPDDRYWNPRSNIKKKGHTFYEFIQAQKEVAQIHGVPCFDLWANQQFSGASASEHYYTDLLHPNGKGYQAVADALVEFLAYGLGSGVLDAYAVLPNATDTAKGLMSAEDKRKIKEIEIETSKESSESIVIENNAGDKILEILSDGTINKRFVVKKALTGNFIRGKYMTSAGTISDAAGCTMTSYDVSDFEKVFVSSVIPKSTGVPLWVAYKNGVKIANGVVNSSDNALCEEEINVDEYDTLYVNGVVSGSVDVVVIESAEIESEPKSGSIGLLLGDSTVQGVGAPINFDVGTYLANEMNCQILNGGIGGTTMVNDGRGANLVKIVDSFQNGDWTDVNTFIDNLIDSQNQSPLFNNLRVKFNEIQDTPIQNIQFICINYGNNDWSSNRALDNDDNREDVTTIGGALRYSIRKLYETSVGVRIFVVAPAYRYDAETPNRLNLTLHDYCDKIVSVCKEIGIPCCNLYELSGINQYTQQFLLNDGVHPNAHGYKRESKIYANFLRQIL